MEIFFSCDWFNDWWKIGKFGRKKIQCRICFSCKKFETIDLKRGATWAMGMTNPPLPDYVDLLFIF